MCEISKLEDLLRSSFDEPAIRLIDYKIQRLTLPGENYASLMLAVEAELKDSTGNNKILNMVAKKIPENEWLQNVCKVQFTLVKEMKFYNTVIPTLQQFQIDQGVEKIMVFFPKYFGGRINLNPGSNVVDNDAVILLENLKLTGYATCDRIRGVDLEVAKFILKDLAVFHAVPIALRLLKPDIFERKIAPHIQFVKMFDSYSNQEAARDKFIKRFQNVAEESHDSVHLSNRVVAALRHSFEVWGTPYETPFATISHNDFWVNNTMVKFENGKPVSNKIIDFQLIDYSSLAKDVVLFLFSSVQMAITEKNYLELITLYFDKFVETLKELKCNADQFTFEDFEKELSVVASRSQFFHCLFMVKPLVATPEGVKELKDLSQHDMLKYKMTDRQREKILFIIREFAKRNWI